MGLDGMDTEDILRKMSVEEKVGQLVMCDGRETPESEIERIKPGFILHTTSSEQMRTIQDKLMNNGSGIPILFCIDAIHGHSFCRGAEIFPTQLTLSCSWDSEPVENTAGVTAETMRAAGHHLTFSPVADLTRDLRWGRVGESFGEDPFLASKMVSAMVKGYKHGMDNRGVLSCVKHFAGYSETEGGKDATEAFHTEEKLRSTFFPPFKSAVDAGCESIMAAYHSINGTPCSASRWLLTDVLRNEWGFEGVVITDWDNVGNLVSRQMVCSDYKEAAVKSLYAGNDVIMVTPSFYDAVLEANQRKEIDEEYIDRACRRIISMKHRLGLFKDPMLPDPEMYKSIINNPKYSELSKEAADKSVVLLKNTHKTLPLEQRSETRILVTGQNADSTGACLGDWALGTGQMFFNREHPREKITTVLDGLKQSKCSIKYMEFPESAEDRETLESLISEAERSDYIVAVTGDNVSVWGEFKSTAKLEPVDFDPECLRILRSAGTPVITVLLNSKPLAVSEISDISDALIEGFNPGMQTGRTIADILFGKTNPSGRLSVSIPRHPGQNPVYYNYYPGQHGDGYADLKTQGALYPFGFGLSYTEYSYKNLKLDTNEIDPEGTAVLSLEIENTGGMDGEETVQLYINDKVSSRTTPVKELKGFKKVFIPAGESVTVSFEINKSNLPRVNSVLESGSFELMAGPNSSDNVLLKTELLVKEK